MVKDFLEHHDHYTGQNPIVSFSKKMKALKTLIKEWSQKRHISQFQEKKALLENIKVFDANIASRSDNFVLDSQRTEWLTKLRNIESNENSNFIQKAKIKWGIEEDENSKFFHATVNQKRRYLSIHGIKHGGHWLTDPSSIKEVFLSFFESKFRRTDVANIVIRSPFYRRIQDDQNVALISPTCEMGIRNAIWDCGSDKSPGPDRFSFALYKKFWDSLKYNIMGFVQEFFKSSSLPRGCNTSFITLILKVHNPMVITDFQPISLIGAQYKIIAKVLVNRLAQVIDSVICQEQTAFVKIRQILDGPLMVSEAIQWCKRKHSKLLVFKIDFENAFDSISWDFLFQVMRFMGFNDTWINWISGCLNNATSSILINGSLSESLHVAIEDAIAAGLYRGLKVCNISFSHLFFTDDALFIGDWSTENISSLVSILECFHKVSALKINFHKSNLFVIGVNFDDVRRAATITGCNAMHTPFTYLGLPIDCNMDSVKNWDPIVDKFNNCLSKWKASMLLIGGKATLVSSVLGSLGTYYLSLFPMPIIVYKKLESIRARFFWGSDGSTKSCIGLRGIRVTASKRNGGLAIGSLFSLNHALIQKWRWRFVNHPQFLWVRLITAIHGGVENVTIFFRNISSQSVWGRIVGSINTMHEKGFIPLSTLSRRVNNGADTKFWLESWMHNSPLNQQMCGRGLLGRSLSWLNLRGSTLTSVSSPQVVWQLDGIAFSPKRLTFFLWRAMRDRLPSMWNLSRKGMDVDSILCPACNIGAETTIHTLWFCSLATTIWLRIFVWIQIPPPSSTNIQDLFSWVDALHLSASKKSIVDNICGVVLWSLWSFRNESIFGSSMPKCSIIIDKIIDLSFRWYTSRNKLSSISWNNWIQNPLEDFSL
nr:putative RNA-directed DNA polymerase, eukaryota, reverse transcriptase zinc-binding domain protein [Tanacetum cinerariifolium]